MLTKKLQMAVTIILMLSAGGIEANGDVARSAELAADGATCHGDDVKGDEDMTAIAGMNAAEHAYSASVAL